MKYILPSATLILALISGNAAAQGNPEEQKIMSKMNTGAYTGAFLYKDVKPLYVIQDDLDFYAIEDNGFKDINPDWIERVDVLKGKSAEEIFGERGGNGVVLIILKEDDKAARKYFRKIKETATKY
jgi:hypothetical protein